MKKHQWRANTLPSLVTVGPVTLLVKIYQKLGGDMESLGV